VSLTPSLPVGACRQDSHCANEDLMCDVSITSGAVCICDPVSGSDACTKHSPCVRMPCAVCSDCLSQVAGFTTRQRFNQNSSDIAAAFTSYCLALGTWSAARCNSTAASIRAAQPSYGKRAGGVCVALGVCGAPALGPSCTLRVALAAREGSPAVSLASPTLDTCTVEGVASGSDVPGTTRNFVLPAGTAVVRLRVLNSAASRAA
jgi:hypothetical protein